MKKKQKAQSGYVMPPDWYQQYAQTYGGIFPNQNGYVNNQMNGSFPEVQVTAQGNPNQRYYGIDQPQMLPINNQRPQAQSVNVKPLELSNNQQQNKGISQQKASNISNGIASVATGVGDVLDFFGDLKRSVLMGGASILNSLIPDQFNKRAEVPVIAYNPDQYGAQQYNNIYAEGGTLPKAQKGKTIYVDNANDPRYKAYQDSLAANNLSNKIIRQMRTYNPGHDDYVRVGPKSAFARPLQIDEVMQERARALKSGVDENHIYIEEFNPQGKYKNWESSQYIGYRVPGEYNFDANGKPFPGYDYYPPPQQRVAIDPTPQVPNVSRIPALGMNSTTSRPQGKQIQWDNVVNDGVFPVYGSDNMLQGMWDTDRNNQIIFYPRNGQTEIPRGLPSNTLIQNPYPTPTNVREMEKGGQLSPSKAKTMLRENQANGKKLTPKQKRYFGYIAGGGKAENGMQLPINDTGYLQGYPTAQNPVNVIPSNLITTDGMGEPIFANGQYLQPNTGTYQFPTNNVLESKVYEVGQELNLTKKEIEALKKQGYEFE